MKEKIEEKINEYLETILNKPEIDKDDYSILTAELQRLKSIEDAKRWADEQEARLTALVKSFAHV